MTSTKEYETLSDEKFIIAIQDSAVGRDHIENKINSFSKLEEGWSFGEGLSFLPDTIELAKQVYLEGRFLWSKVDAFPGLSGEISVEFYAENEVTYEIIIAQNAKITISRETGYGFHYEEKTIATNISFIKFKSKCLHTLRKRFSPGSFIRSITHPIKKDSRVYVSKTPPVVGFQSSNEIVWQKHITPQFASI